MMGFEIEAKSYIDPEDMAAAFLSKYYGNQKIKYPINPFQMLKDVGILFSFRDFVKLEGVYIPASTVKGDFPIVGINVNRPITRQRFTAAHELCHHFRDADQSISCPIGKPRSNIEKFADGFAAALLMPLSELKVQVKKRMDNNGDVSFDDVLEMSDYFGVSFQACLFRVAYHIHAISGNTEPDELRRRASQYGPDKVRKSRHMNYANLYADLIDTYKEQLSFSPTDFSRFKFQNEYIYNDSRMEGLEVTREQAAEIVTDLRLKTQNSVYCKEENEAFLSIAGHYDMYQEIFKEPVKDVLDLYYIFELNKLLFSHYPYPEFGGSTRQSNTLVIGTKFETVDYHDIFDELAKIDAQVKKYFIKKEEMKLSEYIKHVARVHHMITVVHPFPEGNGRTSRAFMNVQFVRAGIFPIYVKVEDKKEYRDALAVADKTGDYDELYEYIFKSIIRYSVELQSDY